MHVLAGADGRLRIRQRDPNMDTIKVEINQAEGSISVMNNGTAHTWRCTPSASAHMTQYPVTFMPTISPAPGLPTVPPDAMQACTARMSLSF
jgi:hypothetical protein